MSESILIGLILAWGVPSAGAPPTDHVFWRMLAMLAGHLGVIWFARLARRQLARGWRNHMIPANLFSRYDRMRVIRNVLSLMVFAISLHVLGYNAWIRFFFAGKQWFWLDKLVLVLPYLLTEIVCLAIHYPVYRAHVEPNESARLAGNRAPSLGSFLATQIRMQMGVWLTGSFVMTIIGDGIDYFMGSSSRDSIGQLIATLLTLIIALTLAPLILRFAWNPQPLPAGEFRSIMSDLAKHLRFRYSDLLLWNTNSMVANAAVSGIFPWPRYVIFTDGLVQSLNLDQLISVFGHEVGHVRHRHIPFFILFTLLSVFFWCGALPAFVHAGVDHYIAQQEAKNPPDLGKFIMQKLNLMPETKPAEAWFDWKSWYHTARDWSVLELLLTALFFGLAFGWVSRASERQADVYGCRVSSLFGRLYEEKPRTDVVPIDPFASFVFSLDPSNPETGFTVSSTDSAIIGADRPDPDQTHEKIHQETQRSMEIDQAFGDSPVPAIEAPANADESSIPVTGPIDEHQYTHTSENVMPSRDPAVSREGAMIFAEGMRRVGLSNGIQLDKWSWRHGSLQSRIDFIEQLARDPQLADRYDRQMRIMRWSVSLLLLAGIFGLSALGSYLFPGRFQLW